MIIRKGNINNITEYLKIYDDAILYMRENGNFFQWTEDYRPDREKILKRLNDNTFYEVVDGDIIVAVFALIFGIDKTYLDIEGKWLNDNSYVTIHMVAKRREYKDIFTIISNYAKARCNNVRIDTHKDNIAMQKAILNNGFSYCGIIHIEDKNKSPRLAYQYEAKNIPFNQFKLFIVDYDGTIVDSMGMWRKTCSGFLDTTGVDYEKDIDDVVARMTNYEAAEYVQNKYFPNKSLDDLGEEMSEYVKKQYVLQKLKDNALSLLKTLKKYGRVVLYSATSLELLNSSMEALGIKDYFDYIYSGSELMWSKNDGIGFLKLIETENVSKNEALVVEDSNHAIEGAKKQDIQVLGVEDLENQEVLANNYSLSDFFLPLNERL